MCGIFALVNRRGVTARDESWAALARERLRLRGPDHQATYLSDDGQCVLAHTRLSIIDPTAAGDQPMVDPATKVTISYNGEIYNFPELRRWLTARGAKFITHCDTEVILKLYTVEGVMGLRRLRGMYAFVLWDPRSRELIAARDSFGIKPLYVWQDADRVVFASQVRALACGLDDPQTEADALLEYGLFGHVFSPETPVRGVREAQPGSIVAYGPGGTVTALPPNDVRQLFDLTPPEALQGVEVAAALEEAVSAHTLSDVPIGILLSAGMDSAVVASRLAAAADPALVRTFTIGFRGADLGMPDETAQARQVAATLGFPNDSEMITSEVIDENLTAYLEAMDQPTVDAVNTFFASRLVHRASVKVALLGTGGDELFGGYPTFWRTRLLATGTGRAAVGLGQVGAALGIGHASYNTDKLGWMSRAGGTLTGAYLVQRGLMAPDQVARAYGCDTAQAERVFQRVHDTLHEEVGAIKDPWSSVSYLETRFYLMPRLLRDADWAGMAHSVELRTPLVDWVLWRRIRSLIAAEQQRRVQPKRSLMTSALAPGVAAQLAPAKLGFGNPYRQLARLAQPDATVIGNAGAAWQQQWARFVAERWSGSLAGDRRPATRVA